MAIIDSIMEEYYRRQQSINEAMVARDNKSSAIIAVSMDASRSFGDDVAYFKYKPNADIDWMHCARISFRYPVYIDHYTRSYKLTRDEKRRLIKMLNSTSSDDKNITAWVSVIRHFNNIVLSNGDKFVLPEDLPMPNYMELK